MSGTISTRWFFSDWLSDTGLRASSLAARGLWKDLLCYAAANRDGDYGFVKIGGRAPTNAALARLLGSTEEEIEQLIAELELNGVFSRDRNGTMYCRRMVRAQKSCKNGKLGGNPKLLKTNETPNPDNHPPVYIPEPEPEPEPKKERSARGTRLPKDWQPSAKNFLEAKKLGLGDAEISFEADKFRDYWLARAGPSAVKLDWDATWRNWCRNAVNYKGKSNVVESDRERGKRETREARERLRAFGEGRTNGDSSGSVVRLLPRTSTSVEPGDISFGGSGAVLQIPGGSRCESG